MDIRLRNKDENDPKFLFQSYGEIKIAELQTANRSYQLLRKKPNYN